MRRNLTVYILKCDKEKYYVGKSLNYVKRINQHFNGEGSKWTKLYTPLGVDKLYQNSDVYDEDKYTLMYMNKYGINNVRGGTYSQIVLPDYHIKTIESQLNTLRDLCYLCGSSGHFVSNCTNRISNMFK